MSWQTWVVEQSPQIKLLIGLGSGILIYILLRWFAYYANKSYQNSIKGKKNRKLPIWEQG